MLIEIIPTFRCNLKCKMCNIPKPTKEVPLENFIKYFKKNNFSVDFLIFSGGEITLRKDYLDFIIKVKETINPRLTTICSNLLFKNKSIKIAEKIRDKDVLISTSIDGAEKTHNTIRRNEYAFQKTISTIKEIRKKYPKVRLNVTMTLLYENRNEILSVYSLTRELGTSFMINLIYPLNFSEYNNRDKKGVILDLKKILKEEMKRTDLSISHKYYIIGFWSKIIKIIKRGCDEEKCVAGKKYLVFAPDGAIYPCSFLLRKGKKIGSIYDIIPIKLKKINCDYLSCFENSKYNSSLTKIKFLSSMLKKNFWGFMYEIFDNNSSVQQ